MCSGIIIAHPTQSVPAIPEPLDRFVGAAGGLPHLIAIRLVCATATAGAPRSAQRAGWKRLTWEVFELPRVTMPP
jgi:hypothetical protein